MQEKIQLFSPIKQRILYFIDSLGISKRSFYVKTGISRGTLESKSGITEETMAKFIASYPNINPIWLISGAGEMLISDNNYNSISESSILKEGKANYNHSCKACIDKDELIKSLHDQIETQKKLINLLEFQNSSKVQSA